MVMTASMRRYLNDTRQSQGMGQVQSVRDRQAAIVGERVPDNLETRKYDDFGLIMNPDQHSELKGTLAQSAAERQKAYGQIDTSAANVDAEVAAAKEGLSYEEQTSDAAWDSYASTFKPVRVVSGSNVEETYMLPDEVISSLGSQVFNKGDGSYTANWVDGGKYYNVDVAIRGTDEKYGKELHEMLQNATSQTKSTFYESAQPEIDLINKYGQAAVDQQSAIIDSEYATALDTLEQQRASVAAAEEAEKAELKAARDQFNKKYDKARNTALQLGRR